MGEAMKFIKTHKSWNMEELIEIIKKSGTYTMCALPHYRYDGVKRRCRSLSNAGMIERVKRDDINVYWKATDTFRHWTAEFESGATKLMPINSAKSKKQDELQ